MSNINKKLFDLKMVQNRSPIGQDDSCISKIWIALFKDTAGLNVIANDDSQWACDQDQYGILKGYCKVIHPGLLGGTWDDFLNDVASVVKQKLLDHKEQAVY